MKTIKRSLCLLLAVLLLAALPLPAALADAGIDPEAQGSIQMHMQYAGRPVSGGSMRMTRVGAVEEENGSYFFRLLPELGGERLNQAALDKPGLADELAANSEVDSLPGQSKPFDKNGLVLFDEDVKPGLYLLVQTQACPGFQKLKPVLVSVPMYNAEKDSYVYDVDATVKPALERDARPTPTPGPSPQPHLPQTGQLNWPVPVMAALGLGLILLGALLLRGGKRKEKT